IKSLGSPKLSRAPMWVVSRDPDEPTLPDGIERYHGPGVAEDRLGWRGGSDCGGFAGARRPETACRIPTPGHSLARGRLGPHPRCDPGKIRRASRANPRPRARISLEGRSEQDA